MKLLDHVSAAMQEAFSQNAELGAFDVLQTRSGHHHDDPNDKSRSTLTFFVKNPLIETNPQAAEEHLAAQLAQIEALKSFIVTESEKTHMQRLSDEWEKLRQAEITLNQAQGEDNANTLPASFGDWFLELPKRNRWDVKHALNVEKTNLGVTKITISVPENIDPATIVAYFKDNKEAILDLLAERVVKYTPSANTDEKKEALRAQVKALELIPTASSNEWGKTVNIDIFSETQRMEMEKSGRALPENIDALVASNPLNALANGDKEGEKDPAGNDYPPHLKKALARAFLFNKDRTPAPIFSMVAGKEDMRRAMGKPLTRLKNKLLETPDNEENAKLVKEIDTFLADDVFKNPQRWGDPVEERPDFALPVHFHKRTSGIDGKPYEPGVMEVRIALPSDKFTGVLEQLAAMAEPQQSAGEPAVAPQDKQWAKQFAAKAEDTLAPAASAVERAARSGEEVGASR